MTDLFWLLSLSDRQDQLNILNELAPAARWNALQKLANVRSSFAETIQLDHAYRRYFADRAPEGLSTKPVRLAILSNSTIEHLCAGIRIGALRRGLWLSTHTPGYGQYMQELLDSSSGLHAFQPTAILFAFDAPHLFEDTANAASAVEPDQILEAACEKLRTLWRKVKSLFGCDVFQQTLLPRYAALVGHNEQRLPASLYRLCQCMNERLRSLADEEQVHLLAIDDQVTRYGIQAWHDPVYWCKAKQEISPAAMPLYGDLMGRLLAAAQGRSKKCRVLDRFGDNGMIGCVIGIADADGGVVIDTWLMSCRVLGRGVEQATLNLAAKQARARDVKRLIGHYIPTAKNGIVRDHYQKLGFSKESASKQARTRWILALDKFNVCDTPIAIKKVAS